MASSDGFVVSNVKVVDHGDDALRFNIVILGDGYKASELNKYHSDVDNFVNTLRATAPYNDLWCALNIYRVDIASTDSGAAPGNMWRWFRRIRDISEHISRRHVLRGWAGAPATYLQQCSGNFYC